MFALGGTMKNGVRSNPSMQGVDICLQPPRTEILLLTALLRPYSQSLPYGRMGPHPSGGLVFRVSTARAIVR